MKTEKPIRPNRANRERFGCGFDGSWFGGGLQIDQTANPRFGRCLMVSTTKPRFARPYHLVMQLEKVEAVGRRESGEMAGTDDSGGEESCGFEWDDESQLYYHASSGFYHDPNAGWYYSSRDGLYYSFENGNYVLLESHKGEKGEAGNQDVVVSDQVSRDEPCPVECANDDGLENLPPPPSEWLEETLIDLYLSGYSDGRIADELKVTSERDVRCEEDEDSEIEEGEWIPEDPSYAAELLERDCNEDTETSGDAPRVACRRGHEVAARGDTNLAKIYAFRLLREQSIASSRFVGATPRCPPVHLACPRWRCLQRATALSCCCSSTRPRAPLRQSHRWSAAALRAVVHAARLRAIRPRSLHGCLSPSSASQDEENWLAQYGQVIQSKEPEPPFPVMDLWDWAMVWETIERKKHGKKKKYKLARLLGKLVRPSAKLHPSVPSGARVLKTPAICEVHVSLVRVSSGQVYRLRSPSLKYLSSLPTYNSSNPTKDWGFPDLDVNNKQGINLPNIGGNNCNQETQVEVPACQDSSALSSQLTSSNKDKSCIYRDRAAERRALHGGYGTGPGQKNSGAVEASSPVSNSTEEAAAEALDMSFGADSYARRIMENMGWKEGEALGSTVKGLKEPLVAVGNKGYAGLGWVQRRPGVQAVE
ncbi:hypothetical protein Syun_024163 [Stephania yunnanensis]|uniref:G-patch domain-containing protein n=1 Tax=Stephania yunnanensis TaxID=152371 RepID=A0AAP0FL04_9MAGN